MTIHPSDLKLEDSSSLLIAWSDDEQRRYRITELRDACPCASCREKRREEAPPALLPVLSAEETQPLAIAAMTPVGSYAYSITFSDGHDTGIFTFELLRRLGEVVNA